MGPKKSGQSTTAGGKAPGKTKKKKTGSGKQSVMYDGLPVGELPREQLESLVRRLQGELDREREEREYFQSERDRLKSFWEISKAHSQKKDEMLQQRDKELEKIEDDRFEERRLESQKIKYILLEQRRTLNLANAEAFQNLASEEQIHRLRENELEEELDKVRCTMELQRLSDHQKIVRECIIAHSDALHAEREKFIKQLDLLNQKWEGRMKELHDKADMRRMTEIRQVEERKNRHLQNLISKHDKALLDMKNYYNDIVVNNLALINSLKEKIEELKSTGATYEKQISDLKSENKKLSEPFLSAQRELEALQKKVNQLTREKVSQTRTKKQMEEAQDLIAKLKWEKEVLTQKLQQVEQERDDLYKKLVKGVAEVHQKNIEKNVLFESQLEVLSETLESKDAQLNEILQNSSEANARLAKKVEDTLESKNLVIRDLQRELVQVCSIHNELLRLAREKLEALGCSVDDPFNRTPLQPSFLLSH